MGVTSEVLGNSAPPHRLEHAGRVWEIRLIDGAAESAFEKRRYERACEGVKTQRGMGLLTDAEYRAELRQKAAAYENGDYDLFSPGGQKFIMTPAGAILLLSILAGCEPGEVVPLFAAKGAEVANLLSLVIRESFPGLQPARDAANTPGGVEEPSLSVSAPTPPAPPGYTDPNLTGRLGP